MTEILEIGRYQKSRVDWSHGLSSAGGRQLQATITVTEQSVAYARDGGL